MISTFFYSKSEGSQLEINVGKNYHDAHLERILLILDALVEDTETLVIFKLHPSIEKRFKKNLSDINWFLQYYNIQENIA